MALTQDELDQVYNYVMGKGQSLSGLPDGGTDLSSMYLAPLLKYSPGGAATLVRLAVSLLKGDSAYQVWVNEPGNAGKTLSDFFAFIKGAKGDPFTFADFTPEQLADLALTYEKLTPEQKEEIKLKFADLTEADILALQKPATDAAAEMRQEMVQISQNANAAIEAANTAAGNAQDAADNVQDGKTPILESVNAQPGDTPSGDFTANGVDALGNPKYILNLTLPAGKDGQPAVFEQGTTTTVEPNGSASVEVVENGTTPEGNPKYILNFSIPRGQQGPPGAGSGNVSADGTGLVIGKKYLFVPDADDSTAGSFVEYVAPEIPEQVQPDWDATEGKGAILNKPSNATADTSGLMSADQFQKLEKLNPSYLSNAVTGKKVEYTDAGKLLFEGKETFAVDGDGNLTLDGKKLSELGGGGAGLYTLPTGLFDLTETSTSEEISIIVGGIEGFNTLYSAVGKTVMTADYTLDGLPTKNIVVQSATMEQENMRAIFLGTNFRTLILVYDGTEFQATLQSEGEDPDWTGWVNKYFYMNSVIHLRSNRFSTDMTSEDINSTLKFSEGISDYIEAEKNDSKPSSPFDILYYYGSTYSVPILYTIYLDNNKNVTLSPKITNYTLDGGTNTHHKVELSVEYNGTRYILAIEEKPDKTLSCEKREEVIGGEFPVATSDNLGGIKVGYTAAEKNYPIQLDASDKAYVNVPWTDTTYSPATQSANGLMSSGDKKKLDRYGSKTTATTVSNLDANYENIEISDLSANASLSVNLTGTAYDTWSIYVAIYCSSARTITIPTSGNYISMIGSSLTCPAGKWTELHLKCLGGKWRIAKLEQE